MSDDASLETERDGLFLPALNPRRFQLAGDDGQIWTSTEDRCAIGAHDSNTLVLADRTVSRFHCEIRIDATGARIRDLGSENGTTVDGVRVIEAWLRDGSTIRLGRTALQFSFVEANNALPISKQTELGSLVGESIEMRRVFPIIERAARSDVTVLVEGETGTGKEEVAATLHELGKRSEGPFVVADMSAIPATLIESELFGHEAGAFTGAVSARLGAFREANGGTLFLDEIGELPLELQPKLLRALEKREVRPLGGKGAETIDVRLIAATNRDLRREVNDGRFRADLYYRLAVVKIEIPPLRKRPDDLRLLVPKLLERLGADRESVARLSTAEMLATLRSSAWPGNVRQLRNYLEQCLVLEQAAPVPDPQPHAPPSMEIDVSLSFAEAKRRVHDAFERRYLERLLEAHGGKAAKAATAAGLHRVHLYRLLRRHGLTGKD
jgi:two-component system, NtrC family, response regulator GlrR